MIDGKDQMRIEQEDPKDPEILTVVSSEEGKTLSEQFGEVVSKVYRAWDDSVETGEMREKTVGMKKVKTYIFYGKN